MGSKCGELFNESQTTGDTCGRALVGRKVGVSIEEWGADRGVPNAHGPWRRSWSFLPGGRRPRWTSAPGHMEASWTQFSEWPTRMGTVCWMRYVDGWRRGARSARSGTGGCRFRGHGGTRDPLGGWTARWCTHGIGVCDTRCEEITVDHVFLWAPSSPSLAESRAHRGAWAARRATGQPTRGAQARVRVRRHRLGAPREGVGDHRACSTHLGDDASLCDGTSRIPWTSRTLSACCLICDV